MKEHTVFFTKPIHLVCKVGLKSIFAYLDFRWYFEANGQILIHFRLMQVQEQQGMTFSHFQIIFQQAGIL